MKLIALGAFALSTLASAAAAQTPAAPAQQQITHGAPLAGVCIYNAQRVLGQSTAGQALVSGMQRLGEEVRGELTPYATTIQTEATALQQAQAAGQPIDDARRQAFQTRVQEAQQLEQTRENELRYTEAMQTQTIGQAAQPIIIAVYQERGCSALLERSAVLIANPQMDISDTVIQRLNAALPTLSFNRMPVPVQQQQQ